MLLSGEPSIIGRDPAGHRATIATHQPALTTTARPAPSTCIRRRRIPVGAATMYTSANAGSTGNACIIFARNAKPIIVPAASSHRVEPRSTARTTQYAPATISITSSASGLLKRNINAATGVAASSSPDSSPAPAPNQRLTAACKSATAATPSTTEGISMLALLKPKIRPDSSITHSDAGGLSTVMKFDESSEPKKNAFQLLVPACTAAA